MSVESWGLASRAQELQDSFTQEATTPGAYILDTVLSLNVAAWCAYMLQS